MTAWLNPGRWLALLLAAALAVAAVRWEYARVERRGHDKANAAWTAQIAKDNEAAAETHRLRERGARLRERSLLDATRNTEVEYAQFKRSAASEAAVVRGQLADLDRLLKLADGGAQPSAGGGAGENPAAASRVDGARVERQLFGHCAETLVGMGLEAERLRGKLTALQGWVARVVPNACQPAAEK